MKARQSLGTQLPRCSSRRAPQINPRCCRLTFPVNQLATGHVGWQWNYECLLFFNGYKRNCESNYTTTEIKRETTCNCFGAWPASPSNKREAKGIVGDVVRRLVVLYLKVTGRQTITSLNPYRPFDNSEQNKHFFQEKKNTYTNANMGKWSFYWFSIH